MFQVGRDANEMQEIEVRLTGQKEQIFKAKKLIFKCGVTIYGGDDDLGADEEGRVVSY